MKSFSPKSHFFEDPSAWQTYPRQTMSDSVDQYIKAHQKSSVAAFFLTLFLGPLGLAYCSWVWLLILAVIAILGAATIVVPVICWLVSMPIGVMAVSKHNKKVVATANLMANSGGLT